MSNPASAGGGRLIFGFYDRVAASLDAGPHTDFNRLAEQIADLAEEAEVKLTAKRLNVLCNNLTSIRDGAPATPLASAREHLPATMSSSARS